MQVFICVSVCYVASVVSYSLQTYGLEPTRLIYPWDSPDKKTAQGLNLCLLCLLHWPKGSLPLAWEAQAFI